CSPARSLVRRLDWHSALIEHPHSRAYAMRIAKTWLFTADATGLRSTFAHGPPRRHADLLRGHELTSGKLASHVLPRGGERARPDFGCGGGGAQHPLSGHQRFCAMAFTA